MKKINLAFDLTRDQIDQKTEIFNEIFLSIFSPQIFSLEDFQKAIKALPNRLYECICIHYGIFEHQKNISYGECGLLNKALKELKKLDSVYNYSFNAKIKYLTDKNSKISLATGIFKELDYPLDKFTLSTRTINSLYYSKILTLRDLINLPKIDLYKIRGLGPKSYKEIENFLKPYQNY